MDIQTHKQLLEMYGPFGDAAAAFRQYAPRNSGEMASWVQGIGTIVAIAVTAWVGLIPVRRDDRRHVTQTTAYLNNLKFVLELIELSVNGLAEATEAKDAHKAAEELSSLADIVQSGLISKSMADQYHWPSQKLRVSIWQIANILGALARVDDEYPFQKRAEEDGIALLNVFSKYHKILERHLLVMRPFLLKIS